MCNLITNFKLVRKKTSEATRLLSRSKGRTFSFCLVHIAADITVLLLIFIKGVLKVAIQFCSIFQCLLGHPIYIHILYRFPPAGIFNISILWKLIMRGVWSNFKTKLYIYTMRGVFVLNPLLLSLSLELSLNTKRHVRFTTVPLILWLDQIRYHCYLWAWKR